MFHNDELVLAFGKINHDEEEGQLCQIQRQNPYKNSLFILFVQKLNNNLNGWNLVQINVFG